ncbi:hypothetical protein V492_03200 [Pseudogymnoascus sp. VKM F-4246]|nr:hypothetical protein V492_03200 [Pseudogymnoascus sp. VKM F-4246]
MAFLEGEHLHDSDDESANLITKLQLEDSETCGSSSKGKDPSGECIGESDAFEQQQQLENENLRFSDHDLAYGFNPNAEQSESSTGHKPAKVASVTTLCEACRDDKNLEDISSAPCGHEYCHDCLLNLVKTAVKDDSLFPPRCCRQPIPFKAFHTFLTPELSKAFVNKEDEFDTLDKTYCSVPTCSAFIVSGNVACNVGTCHQCGSKTCIRCKAAAHGKKKCKQNPALEQVWDIVIANGWQRCYKCSSFIELNRGCNHITCRCGAEFCYVCGWIWKSCDCAQWDEDRLLDHANIVVARQPRSHGFLRGVRDKLVQLIADALRSSDQCAHRECRV